MKAKEARTYVAECVAAINEAKKTDLRVVNSSVYKMRSVAKAADHIRITIEVEPFLHFDLCLDLFLKISDRNKREYQEALMTEIWMQAKKIRDRQKQLQQINNISSSILNQPPATMLTKAEYDNLMRAGKIDRNKLYVIADENIGTPRVSAMMRDASGWGTFRTDPIQVAIDNDPSLEKLAAKLNTHTWDLDDIDF